MADRNNNGVPDEIENAFRLLESGRTPRVVKPNQGIGQVGDFFTDVARQGGNFLGDQVRYFAGKNPTGGFGLGDYAFGVSPERARQGQPGGLERGVRNARRGPGGIVQGLSGGRPPMGDTQLPSFMSFLQQAMGMSGGPERISYDPQRADARRRGAEYDARIAAMYNQLANSMRDDGAGIQKNFQGAIDDTAARSAETQQAIQGASDSADARNMEVLRNLGIEDAQAGIIQGGRDLNTQAAGNVAEAAARGQIAGDALTQNQQAAGAHNANLVGAAGLEGNLQRARVQSELSSLLAQYDMQEQEANRQAQQQSLSQSMGLANALYEDAWRQQGYNDDMTRWLYEQQQAANQPAPVDPGQMGLNFIAQLQKRFPDLAMDDLLKMVQGVGTIGKLYG